MKANIINPRFFFLIFLVIPFIIFSSHEKAVTFGDGGRLGDNILDYTHAKWISYKWGIPLFFNSFEYADQFVFYDMEEQLTPEKEALFTKRILHSFAELEDPVNLDTLYFVNHVCDSYHEYVFTGSWNLYIPVDWNDEYFRSMMRSLIYPKNPLNLIKPPQGIVTVALHYRTGGGFVWDDSSMKKGLPLRFPQHEYYVEQLLKLHALVHKEPLYVFIFTDDPQPEKIKELFRKNIQNKKIHFACRSVDNRHDANVLEDLFSMMQFDCLIRPMSHYSMTASHLGDFKIEFFPTHGRWHRQKFVVDQVETIKKASWDPKTKSWVFIR